MSQLQNPGGFELWGDAPLSYLSHKHVPRLFMATHCTYGSENVSFACITLGESFT